MSASTQFQSHGTPAPPDITGLLLAWGAGDRAALDALVPAVYAALHAQAARETVEALGVSPVTANREWVVASAWRRRELEDGAA